MKLELRNISKIFGTLRANDNISFTAESGRIHVLLGENGAGKSTLMNVLYGLYRPDEGEIFIDDKKVEFKGPNDAMDAGIGMVHQHFMLIPVFSVAENLILGNETTNGPLGIIDIKTANEKVREISKKFDFDVNPEDIVENLPVGIRQRVEIIKALSRDAKILIFDEPTAVLTPQETDELMEIMTELKNDGKLIIFITHKLREVKAVADDITVIRRGKVVGSCAPTDSETEMASRMVGREVSLTTEKKPAEPGSVALELLKLSLIEKNGETKLSDINLQVKKGEVLAIAGVQGNGQTELAEILLGLRKPTTGDIKLGEKSIVKQSVKERLEGGIGFVPEDRNLYGLVEEFSIEENLVLDKFDAEPYGKLGVIKPKVIREKSEELVEKFDIRISNITDSAKTLSGGNQQKIVVAREMSKDLKLFIASQPTRGLDVGSIEFIHKEIISLRDSGVPVVVISTELDEIYDLADKIAVMYKGTIIGVVDASTSRDKLGLMMAGIKSETGTGLSTGLGTGPGTEPSVGVSNEPGIGTGIGTRND
jgi:simple sugar transport system ATP-binding protein